ncbi:MAG: hypothetical protein Q4A67_03165 [Aerococcus sp.]|nr:hypothetical protein [Aerococcus sp.]
MKRQHLQQARQLSEREQKNRINMQLQNMRYRRFMMLRYCLAIFFFSNVSWLIMQTAQANALMIVPIFLLLLNIGALVVMQRRASQPTSSTSQNLFLVRLSLIAQAAIGIVWLFTLLFLKQEAGIWIPIFTLTPAVQHVLSGLLLFLVGYAAIGIGKVLRMEQKQDRWYQPVKQFEQQLGG